MMEMLEQYRETHGAIFRYKNYDANKEELSKILIDIGQSLKNNDCIEKAKVLHPRDKATAPAATTSTKSTTIIPVNPLGFKFLYAKENHKLEIHMELEWIPK